jgi:hypothetical protein
MPTSSDDRCVLTRCCAVDADRWTQQLRLTLVAGYLLTFSAGSSVVGERRQTNGNSESRICVYSLHLEHCNSPPSAYTRPRGLGGSSQSQQPLAVPFESGTAAVAACFVKIEVTVAPWNKTGLLWFNNHLFVLSDSKIKQFEASTGSAVSEWPVPDSNNFSCIGLPKHGRFIAYTTRRTVTF